MHITLTDLTADYPLGPTQSTRVLQQINVKIQAGSYTAVIGHTGSGKSSLLKTINGLLLPTAGQIQIGQTVIAANQPIPPLTPLRRNVGMVFQFPEAQLFAETVEADLCFGPLNFGMSERDAKVLAREAAAFVGLDETLLAKSPFTLSGGQKRRAAIAGILAMKPKVLLLDEPGAGLDPQGKKEIMELIATLHRDRKLTILLVTHDMNDAAQYADDIIIMNHGQLVLHEHTRNAFQDLDRLAPWDIELPDARKFQRQLEQTLGLTFANVCLTVEELANTMAEVRAYHE